MTKNLDRVPWAARIRGAIELGRWKIQRQQLGRELKKKAMATQQKVLQLGPKAWEEGTCTELAEPFEALQALQHERDGIVGELANLGNRVSETDSEKQAVEGDFARRLGAFEETAATAKMRWKEAVRQRTQADKSLKADSARQRNLTKKRKALEAKVAKLDQGAPDVATMASDLQQQIQEIDRQRQELAERLASTQTQMVSLTEAETICKTELDAQQTALQRERESRVRALGPLDGALQQLRESMAEQERHRDRLDDQMRQRLEALSEQIDQSRPNSEALVGLYQQVDALRGEERETQDDLDQLDRRISGADGGALWILSGAAAAALIVVVVSGAWLFQGPRDGDSADFAFFSSFLPSWSRDTSTELTVRVADASGAAVHGARVLLFAGTTPLHEYTDSTGTARLEVEVPKRRDALLVIEAPDYKIHEREIQLPGDDLWDVQLEAEDPEVGDVIVRVVESNSGRPLNGAKVLILNAGEAQNQRSDSNGITKFTTRFDDGTADIQMSVETKRYEISQQRVTLRPNAVQDVALDRQANSLAVSDVAAKLPANSSTLVVQQTPFSVPHPQFDLILKGCIRLEQEVHCQFQLSSLGIDRQLTAYRSTAFDDLNHRHDSDKIYLGNHGGWGRETSLLLLAGVPTDLTYIFRTVSNPAQGIKRFELRLGVDGARTIELRDIPLTVTEVQERSLKVDFKNDPREFKTPDLSFRWISCERNGTSVDCLFDVMSPGVDREIAFNGATLYDDFNSVHRQRRISLSNLSESYGVRLLLVGDTSAKLRYRFEEISEEATRIVRFELDYRYGEDFQVELRNLNLSGAEP